jgi:ABC-type molybdate transport system permease subunit
MSFWRGLGIRIGGTAAGWLILVISIALASQITSEPDKIMVYSLIILPLLTTPAVAGVYYVFD